MLSFKVMRRVHVLMLHATAPFRPYGPPPIKVAALRARPLAPPGPLRPLLSCTIESDETVIGGKTKNRAYAKKEPKKHTVLTLVERDGHSRSFHVANIKAKTLREKIVATASRKSHLMTDELASYGKIGKEFANHSSVNHSADEYVRLGGFVHVYTAECRFSLMKRAVFGTHIAISEAHLARYLIEWDHKWNYRKTTDAERAAIAPMRNDLNCSTAHWCASGVRVVSMSTVSSWRA